MDNVKVKKAIEIKAKNKRFTVIWYDNETVCFYTKTLQDFKNRIITKTSGIYSFESFLVLFDALQYIYTDPEFEKATNRIKGQLAKDRPIGRVYA